MRSAAGSTSRNGGIGERDAAGAEIVADVERQLVGAGRRPPFQQRLVGAAVGVGDGFRQHLASRAAAPRARRRPAGRCDVSSTWVVRRPMAHYGTQSCPASRASVSTECLPCRRAVQDARCIQTRRYGTRMVDPVVSRPSRSWCAFAASFSGYFWLIGILTLPLPTTSNRCLAMSSRSSRLAA